MPDSRRLTRRQVLQVGSGTAAGLAFIMLVSPVLIQPLFNKYQPVPEGPVKAALVEQAQRADIPPEKIFMYDGSRQSNNFTANVSGVMGSARIAISDVAMKQAVQRLWTYCNVLRDDGLSYGDYVEQLTYLLFLKMADEQRRPPFKRPAFVPAGVAITPFRPAERRRPPAPPTKPLP